MAITIGMGEYIYEYEDDWPHLPAGHTFQGPSSVAVDSRDRVYVFQRRGPPILVFDQEGDCSIPGTAAKHSLMMPTTYISAQMTASISLTATPTKS